MKRAWHDFATTQPQPFEDDVDALNVEITLNMLRVVAVQGIVPVFDRIVIHSGEVHFRIMNE